MATRNWNEASVTNATAANTIDTEINNVRTDVRERMAVDHEWDSSDSGASSLAEIGQHTKITFAAPIASPTAGTNTGFVFIKDVVTGTNTTAELHFLDENDNELQMTVEGKFNVGGNIVADAVDQDDIRLENDSYLTGRNNADDGDINIVKVNTSDTLTFGAVCTLPDTSALATDGAPVADAQISNKKYVDDTVATEAALRAFGAMTGTDSDSAALVTGHTYKVTSDGFVFGWVTNSGDGDSTLYVHTSSPATGGSLVLNIGPESNDTGAFMIPIQTGKYWRFDLSGTGNYDLWWLPMGSGECQDQD